MRNVEEANMAYQNLEGEWQLISSASTRSEISFINEDEPDPNGVTNWLNGLDDSLLESAKQTSGLVLSIKPDGSFTEVVTGKPEIYWFDAEGVLVDEVTPFNGVTVSSEKCTYLKPDAIAAWAIPVDGLYGESVLRYDDSDTKIADNLRLVDGHLVRTVNVVTDELYLDRVLIKYKRTS